MKSLWVIALILAGTLVVAGCDNDDPTAICDDTTVDITTLSSDYLNNRFFRLDLPVLEVPFGRFEGDKILENSIQIFQLLPGQPMSGDIVNVAVYVDSTGYQNWETIDFNNPHAFGRRWKEITNWTAYRDAVGNLIAVDLGTQMPADETLAVIYDVQQADGTVVQVGDLPGTDVPQQEVIGGDGDLYYRMKLLKAPVSDVERWTFQYVMRNIYPLGGSNIDLNTFDLRIEANEPGNNQPQQDENGLDYIRVFGLDRDNPQRTGTPDGVVDYWDPYLIDLDKGLLTFPQNFPTPFAPGGNPYGRLQEADMMAEAVYTAYADTTAFVWDPSYLRDNQSWQIYDPEIYPGDYSQYGAFSIIATFERPDDDDP